MGQLVWPLCFSPWPIHSFQKPLENNLYDPGTVAGKKENEGDKLGLCFFGAFQKFQKYKMKV